MRLMVGLVSCIVGLAIVGCGGPPKPKVSSPATTGTTGPGGSNPAVIVQVPDKPELSPAVAKAQAFVADLIKGDAPAAAGHFSAAFRKELAPPAKTEDDQKAGYSASRLANWLKDHTGQLKKVEAFNSVTSPTSAAVSLRGNGIGGDDKPLRVTFRVQKTSTGWEVDSFVIARHQGTSAVPASGEVGWANEFAVEFLDALFANELRIAVGSITQASRVKLAPPFKSDEESGNKFNRGKLELWLRTMRGEFTGYVIEKGEASGNSASFSGTLTGPSKAPFTLKLSKDGDGWRVDEFNIVGK